MSREDIVAIAARLFAAVMFFNLVKSIPPLVQAYSPEIGWAFAIPQIVSLFAGLILCVVLWFLPLPVARRLLPAMNEPRSEQTIDASIALTLGLTLLGVWFLTNALIDCIYWLVMLARVKQSYDTSFYWDHATVASIYATAAELVLAIWLLVGTAGIKRAIYRFRR